MISLDDPESAVPHELLDAPGGFAWWYAEILDPAGYSVVLIWSFGLPFLPGYASALRRGRPERPGARPSVSISVYDQGKPVFYVLREYEPNDVEWSGDEFRFGESRFSLDRRLPAGTLVGELNIPLGGGAPNLTGSISIRGSAPVLDATSWPIADSPHRWTPLACPAAGQAELRSGSFFARCAGEAYLDRNHSAVGLEALGIREWVWGRVGEKVFYVLENQSGSVTSVGIELREDGTGEVVPLQASMPRGHRTVYGMRRRPWIELRHEDQPWLRVDHESTVDTGPFYLREHVRSGSGQAGTLEVITPHRIDLPQHRPLVRMRVTRPVNNSIWLPLFEGPSSGRIRRLLRRR
jgi:hypothetical protein